MTPQLDQPNTAAAPKSGPTGPRTEEGKSRCRLNAFRHGLTAQIFFLWPAEAETYRKHHAEIVKHYRPVGPVESAVVDEISTGIWRLQRVHAIEEGLFALHAEDGQPGDTVDALFGPVRAWIEQGKSLSLLSTYEGRIRRALDRDKAELTVLQAARKQQEPATPKPLPAPPESVFSPELTAAKSIRRQPSSNPKSVPTNLEPVASPESVFSPEVAAVESMRRQAHPNPEPLTDFEPLASPKSVFSPEVAAIESMHRQAGTNAVAVTTLVSPAVSAAGPPPQPSANR